MQHSAVTDRVAGTTPEANAERANATDRVSGVTRALGAIGGVFALVRERYAELTDAAKARVEPVGEALRRAQLRFLAGTDRWKERAVAMPGAVRRLVREPDDAEQLRRRLGGVGIALFAVLAIGSLAVLKPAGRSADRSASGPASSGAATTSTSGASTPTTRPVTTTSPSTTIPGQVGAPERPSRRSAPRPVVRPSVSRGPAVVAATSTTSGTVTTSPATPPGTGPTTRPTRPTSPATSPSSSTPGGAPTTSSTTTATPPTPASPPAAAPVLTFDLALNGDGSGGSFCLFGIELLGGGACERAR